MPPVGTITLVLPALIASRTSIQVISSSHTVFGAGRGFGVSAQLYGLSRQSPPPIDRGSGSRRWRCCAAVNVPANTVTLNAINTIFFIDNLLSSSFYPERPIIHALAELAVAVAARGAERGQRCLGRLHAAEAEIDQDRVGVL